MYALRERRVHVTQEDFEMAVAKVSINLKLIFECSVHVLHYTNAVLLYQVMQKDSEKNMSIKKLWK